MGDFGAIKSLDHKFKFLGQRVHILRLLPADDRKIMQSFIENSWKTWGKNRKFGEMRELMEVTDEPPVEFLARAQQNGRLLSGDLIQELLRSESTRPDFSLF